MRDVIWTAIVIWLIYKIVSIFRNQSSKKNPFRNEETDQTIHPHDQEIKEAIRRHVNKEGEYVDFEEIK